MIKRLAHRTLGITAAITNGVLRATTAVSAFAANDDMDAVSLANKLVGIGTYAKVRLRLVTLTPQV